MNEPNDIQASARSSKARAAARYWRSLEAVSETPEFKEYLHREFPQNASEWLDPVGRRGFLKLMGASLALAGVSACTRQPEEAIVPYVRSPRSSSRGSRCFTRRRCRLPAPASVCWSRATKGGRRRSKATPIIRRACGATDLFAQASILDLYDPDRSQTLTHLGEIRPFEAFAAAIRQVLARSRRSQGAASASSAKPSRRRRWTRRSTSSCGRLPQAKWIQWEPFGRHNAREGSRLAFGEYVDAKYSIEQGRRHPVARRRFPGHGQRCADARPCLLRRAAGARATARSSIASTQSRARRPTPGRRPTIDCRFGPRTLSALPAQWRRSSESRRRRGGSAPESASWLGPLVKDLQNATRPQPGDRRRRAAAGRPRARARDERRARERRQHGHLHADGRAAADESARRARASWSAR